jgi:hypothetical protein
MIMKFTQVNTRRYNVSSARLTEPVRRSLTKREELQRKLFEQKMKRNGVPKVNDTGWYVVK